MVYSVKAAVYKTMKLTDLIPADYNPRKDLQPGDKDWEKISDSLQNFGLVEPLTWMTMRRKFLRQS